jgi:hypothetical protein
MEAAMSARTLGVAVLGFALGCQVPATISTAPASDPGIGVARQGLLSAPGDGPGGAHIIYLNFDGNGGTLYPMDSWPEDSSTNKSQILYSGVNQPIPMPKFDPSPYAGQYTEQQAIDTITTAFRGYYAPFNVQIVTSRPATGRYTMCVIGGNPQDVLGSGSGAAGIAPLDCNLGSTVSYNEVEPNITFAFSAGISPQATGFSPSEALKQIAITAGQETAHAFGLEHTLNTMDIMYPQLDYRQSGFGPLADLQVTPSECDRTSTQQDSAGKMAMIVGASNGTPPVNPMMPPPTVLTPTVKFIAPKPGETVPDTFTFVVDATESGGSIAHVDVSAGTQSIGSLTGAPYRSTLTAQGDGTITLSATAYDANGGMATANVSFTISSTASPQVVGCGLDVDCGSGQTCKLGVCVTGGSVTPADGGTTPGSGSDGGGGVGLPPGNACNCPSGTKCQSDGTCAPLASSGAVGSACGPSSLCNGSAICAQFDGHGICTVACNPDQPGTCPASMTCADVGGRHFCQPKEDASGCSVAPGASPSSWPAMLLLVGCLVGLGRRRGRV